MGEVIECLAERGHTATFDEATGALSTESPPTFTSDQIRSAIVECRERAGLSVKPPALSQADFEKLYERTIATRDCLVQEGWEVPAPPSFQVFVDEYETEPFVPYAYVYSGANAPSAAQARQLEQTCPQPAL